MPPTSRLTRRRFLAGVSLFLGVVTSFLRPPRGEVPVRRRLLVVIFGGGVRPEDSGGEATLAPALFQMGETGARLANVRPASDDPTEARLAFLLDPRRQERQPPDKNRRRLVFEALRQEHGLPQEAMWFISDGPVDSLLEASLWPLEPTAQPSHLNAGLLLTPAIRAALPRLASAGAPPEGLEELLRVIESRRAAASAIDPDLLLTLRGALLEELERPADPLPGAGDRRVLRLAAALFRGRTSSLVVALLAGARSSDVSFEDYATVIRGNDALLGEIEKQRQADGEMQAEAGMIVVPDVPRAREAAKNGSVPVVREACVSVVATGAGFKPSSSVKRVVPASEIPAAIMHVLGFKPPIGLLRNLRPILD